MKSNIKIFYHVLLENHWYSIVKEQFDKVRDSGLLEHVSEFYITLSTPEDIEVPEKNKRIQFFYDHFLNYIYPEDMFYNKKFEILFCNKLEFEYPTLEKAIEISKQSKDFIGLYFHTKGASNPDYTKDQWRDGLNVGTIDYWTEHIDKIKEGYDMSGMNHFKNNPYIKIYKQHFSGNFFFFNPEFFSQIDFSQIDKSLRYYAESIYGSHYNPKCYNIGYLGKNTPFMKGSNALRKRVTV